MANIGNITVTIGADTFTLGRQLKSAEGKIKGFTRKTESSFNRMRQTILSARSAIIAFGFVGGFLATKVFGKVIQETVKFEDSMLDLQKVMTDAEGNAKRFTSEIDAMSVKYATSGADLLQGVANFKQAAFGLKESFELQRIASETAVAGNISVAESSELIVRALKGFRAPAKEAGRLTDIANEISNRYATTLQELLKAMAKASPIAKNFGFSMGKELLDKVIGSFDQLTDTQKAFFTSQLVGVRQAARFTEVLTNQELQAEILGTAYDSAGSRAKEYGVKSEALGFKINALKEQFKNLAREVGDALSPKMKKFLDAASEVVKRLKEDQGDNLNIVAKLAKAKLEDLKRQKDDIVSILKVDVAILNATRSTLAKAKEQRAIVSNRNLPTISGSLRTDTTPGLEGNQGAIARKEQRRRLLHLSRLDTPDSVFRSEAQENLRIVNDALGRQGFLQASNLEIAEKEKRILEQKVALIKQSINAEIKANEKRKQQAESLKESLKTDFDILQDNLRLAQDLFDHKNITAEQLSKAQIRATESFLDARLAERQSFDIAVERLNLNATNFALAQFDREMRGYKKLVKQGKLDAAELEKFRIDSMQRIQAQNSVMWINMIQAANRFSDDLSDTFADWVETGKFSFQSTATEFARMVNKMVFQLLVIQPLMDTLFGSAGGGNATGLGIVGNFLFPKKATQQIQQQAQQQKAVQNFTKMFNGETGEMFDKFAKDKKGMDKMFEDNMKGLADIAETTAKDMNKGFDDG
ncbi:MAG: phage tail tape measure protein, partial [Planctomycetota bacterium]